MRLHLKIIQLLEPVQALFVLASLSWVFCHLQQKYAILSQILPILSNQSLTLVNCTPLIPPEFVHFFPSPHMKDVPCSLNKSLPQLSVLALLLSKPSLPCIQNDFSKVHMIILLP